MELDGEFEKIDKVSVLLYLWISFLAQVALFLMHLLLCLKYILKDTLEIKYCRKNPFKQVFHFHKIWRFCDDC